MNLWSEENTNETTDLSQLDCMDWPFLTMWTFWSVKDAEGGQSILMSNSSHYISTKIFHMKPSAKIWDFSEVTEAHSLASEGFGSDQGQNEKILGENPKITNFWLTEK